MGNIKRTILPSLIYLFLINRSANTARNSISGKRTTPHQSIHKKNVATLNSDINTDKGSVREKTTVSKHPVRRGNLTTSRSGVHKKESSIKRKDISDHHHSHKKSQLSHPASRIIRGNGVVPASDDQFRHIVMIQEWKTRKHRAAGTLFFGGQWILTTRSALADVGTIKLDNQPGGTQFTITRAFDVNVWPKHSNKRTEIEKKLAYVSEKTFCHPFLGEESEEKEFTDIGLIKLTQDISLIYMGAQTGFESIELVDDDVGDLSGVELDIAGWGVYDDLLPDNPLSDHLMTTRMTVMRDCINPSKIYRPSAHMCSFKNDTSLCTGDGGGPAIWSVMEYTEYRRYLVGVLGFSDQEKCKGNSIFMRVTYFRDFIDYVRRHEPYQYECRNMVNRTNPRPMNFR